MKHSLIQPAAEIHARWCSCRKCAPEGPGQASELRALRNGLIAGLLVIALLVAGVL